MTKEAKPVVLKQIFAYIFVFFALLAALFGGQIMSFIFGQLGPNAAGIEDASALTINETGAWLNATTYTVDNAGVNGFSNLVITSAVNATDNSSIGLGNFTVSGSGFTNATAQTWPDVTVSYSYNYFTDAKAASAAIQEESLNAIVVYSEGASTQMNTLSIAVILLLLISIFFIFWKIFISDGSSKKSAMGGTFAAQ